MRVCQGPCGRNRGDQFYKGPRGRICVSCQKSRSSEAARNRRLEETYEVTPEEWDLILKLVGYKCGACAQKRSYRLNVDHDHKVERTHGMRASLRGPLCRRCNKVLRDIRYNIEVLQGLIDYLRDPPARKVLSARDNQLRPYSIPNLVRPRSATNARGRTTRKRSI